MSANKILIIDDDEDFVESVRVVLEASGYKLASAANKEEGLKQIEAFCPHLIILDVVMEKMSDGFDLSRKLKNSDKYKKIPIIVVTAVGEKTGFSFSPDAGDAAWLPVNDYLEKPIKPNELISRIEKLLESQSV